MKIEIWSDVICPFCYIGKANLETGSGAGGAEADIAIAPFACHRESRSIPPIRCCSANMA